MKAIARSLVVVLVALLAVPALVVTATITTAVQLLATTALILGGTQHSLGPDDDPAYVPGYLNWATNGFIVPGYTPQPAPNPINMVAVIYPAQFAPVTGTTTFDNSVDIGRDNLSHCLGASVGGCNYNTNVGSQAPDPATDDFLLYGYSQGAVVVSLVKNDIIDGNLTGLTGTQAFLTSNPMRPNGGILARGFEGFTIPIIGITFYGPTKNSCEPTGCVEGDTLVIPSVDVAQEYDFLGGEAPARPLNILAMVNSIMAYSLLHGDVQNHTLNEPGIIDQGTYGDTHYYLIPSETVPILLPLVNAGVPAPALAIPNEILKVWINDAYVRDKSPGEHVTFQWSPIGDPIALIGNTLGAIPVGIDDTVEGFTTPGNRPLGTQPSGPYGVGGPDPDQTPTLAAAAGPEPTLVEEQQPESGDNKLALVPNNPKDLGNDAVSPKTTPEVIKPALPFEKWRESFKADPDHRPLGIRPNGDGPLKRIVNAITGQRPKPETKDVAPKPEQEQDAA